MTTLRPTIKQDLERELIQVHSMFHTIQGEGPLAGFPALFVRLSGCNLCCHWCDTDYQGGVFDSQETVARKVLDIINPHEIVVITGGEPLAQPIKKFVELLLAAGRVVQIETSGSLSNPVLDLLFDETTANLFEVVVSPKTGKLHRDFPYMVCSLKYVVAHGELNPENGLPIMSTQVPGQPNPVFTPTATEIATLRSSGQMFVSPRDDQDPERNKRNTAAAVDVCMRYGYRLSLQQHKILGIA